MRARGRERGEGGGRGAGGGAESDADLRSARSTFDIELLGGVVTQGLVGYITMGVNMSASYEA